MDAPLVSALTFTRNEVAIKKMSCPLLVDGEFFFFDGKNMEMGVRGILPPGCLTLWEREGVTLTTTTEDFLNNTYIEDFYRAIISPSS